MMRVLALSLLLMATSVFAAPQKLTAVYHVTRNGQPFADELDQLTVASDEEVSGYFKRVDLRVIWVLVRVQLIGEQINDAVAAELTRRQADVVDHNQRDRCIDGACIPVGRVDETDALYQACRRNCETGDDLIH